ncbi:DUF3105 domain-containing protein [Streptomyces sp. NPDC046985]|uniref:DUF3105 domain-containing protein n=1 Tax=Streptomyces sp. NPDC046985 TaxID=3155377 RepID=UPI0034093D1F
MGSVDRTGTTAGAEQRKARIEQMRRAEQARRRRNRLIAVAAGVVAVAALAAGGVALIQAGSGDDTAGKAAGPSGGAKGAGHFVTGADGVRTWQGALGRTHTTAPVTYPMEPPVGGDHNPVWQNCNGDVYDKPVQNVHAVHALEHGAVWVTYNDKAPKADVTALAAKVHGTPYTLMSPVPDQKDPIMLSAWGRQRTVTGAHDPALDKFFAAFVQGPQTPEPGAACTGGVSQ